MNAPALYLPDVGRHRRGRNSHQFISGIQQANCSMWSRFLAYLAMTWLVRVWCSADVSNPIEIIDVHSPKAVKNAEFAVHELSKLSDSEIYETLQLQKIVYAAEQDGIFHFNTLLTLELASPHFKSGKMTEEYRMIVMLHKEDGVRSLAIDEFPMMDDDAIEAFYIRKIERRRKEREEAFRRLELEAQLYEGKSPVLDINNVRMKEEFSGKTIAEVLVELDTPERRAERQQDSARSIQTRLSGEQLADERSLQQYSLRELYEVVTGQLKATDFQMYRAKTLLDAAMASLPR
jgi:hypothetical protein